MNILVTGGTGFIGAELARTLVSRGENVVLFDIYPNYARIGDIKDKVKVVQGNLAYWAEVFNVVKNYNIEGIHDTGSMLSATSEASPWASFQTNVVGTMHILEAARLFGVGKVVFTSTLATYGLACPAVVTDETIQRPITMYGCGKLYCEVLGMYYRNRFDMDFRTVRYPAVIGPGINTPGIAQWNAWMIEYPALGKPFECYVTEDTKVPVLYFKDAVRAVDMIFQAPKEQIKMVNYNVGGVTPSRTAKELEQAVKSHIPDAQISYKPDPKTMEVFRTMSVDVFDDSKARQEWGWQPLYSDFDKVVSDTIKEIKMHPERYGLA